MTVPAPLATFTDQTYRFTWDEATLLMEQLAETRDGDLRAEITVTSPLADPQLVVPRQRLNLLAAQTLDRFARQLAERVKSLDWPAMLAQAAELAVDRWREGSPLLELGTVDDPGRPQWLLEPFLETSGATVLFAPGGSGKSYLALAAAQSIATGMPLAGHTPTEVGPVAYLDWEADPLITQERLSRLGGAEGVWYRRESLPLHVTADRLRGQFTRREITAVVIDSLGMARGGAPESAEDTIRLFAAIRALGVPALCIDHLAKYAMRQADGRQPFGSVYTVNASRVCWSMATINRPGEIFCRLENTKRSNGRRLDPFTLTVAFTDDGVEVWTSDGEAWIPTDGTLGDRIEQLIDLEGPRTADEMADALGANTDSIRKALARDDRFASSDSRPKRWGLRADTLPDPM